MRRSLPVRAAPRRCLRRCAGGRSLTAVLPIENSLHGSVAEHYDLLLEHEVAVVGERLLRIRHNVMAAPGVRIGGGAAGDVAPGGAVAVQKRWLRAHPEIEAVPFYDTAGSVKSLMADGSARCGGDRSGAGRTGVRSGGAGAGGGRSCGELHAVLPACRRPMIWRMRAGLCRRRWRIR